MVRYQIGADWRVGPVDVENFDHFDGIDDWMAARNAQLAQKDDADLAGREAWDEATRSGRNLQAPRPSDLTMIGARYLDQGNEEAIGSDPTANSAHERAPLPLERPHGPQLSPPTSEFAREALGGRSNTRPANANSTGLAPAIGPSATGFRGAGDIGGRIAGAGSSDHPMTSGGPRIAYGTLRANAPSDQELAELRRQQAAFANTARQIDIQNSWLAAPVLAAPLAAMGLEGIGALAGRALVRPAEEAVLNFFEREPYLRVGDNWATRAGRRAHDALKERVAQKPGWESEPRVPLRDGRILRPDVRTPPRIRAPGEDPKPFQMELKPNTPSGRQAAARAVKKYKDTGAKTRPIFYDPKPFI